MALNASGAISLGGSTVGQSIALELGLSATGQISLNDAAVRTLAQVASGAIVMPTNFWGKANTPTGSLYSWGYNQLGEMGNSTRSTTPPYYEQATPVLTSGGSSWTSVVPGYFGVKSDGTMWSWGAAQDTLSGLGTGGTRSSPVQIGALTNWKQVTFCTGGGAVGLAVKTDGTMWVWGNNGAALGLNSTSGSVSSPTQIGSLTTWSFVGAGNNNAAAVKSDGTMWVWGRNNYGQLGLNNTEIEYSSPTQLGASTDWEAVSMDNYNTVTGALKTNGTIWLIGGSPYLYGGNSIPMASSPIQIGSLTNWDFLSRFMGQGPAWIKTDGTLWTCGTNYSGQLGLNNRIGASSPVQVGALTTWNYAAKARFATLATKTDGTLWSWGSKDYGLLGDTGLTRSSPVQVGVATTWKTVFGTGDLNAGGLQ